MAWNVIVGNGLAIDASVHAALPLNPTYPWKWDIRNPENPDQAFLSVLENLDAELSQRKERTVYDALARISNDWRHLEDGAENATAVARHWEACQFIRHAYAHFSTEFARDSLKSWPFRRWLRANRNSLLSFLSFNYDTVLEDTLASVGVQYWHAGSLAKSPMSKGPKGPWSTGPGGRHIAKPHGSASFVSWLSMGISDSEGHRKPSSLFPRPVAFVRNSSVIRVAIGNRMHEPSVVADVILPGQLSSWQGHGASLQWVTAQVNQFVLDSRRAERLLVVGFGYGPADRQEFDGMLGRLHDMKSIHVVDPQPKRELLEALGRLTPNLEVHASIDSVPLV